MLFRELLALFIVGENVVELVELLLAVGFDHFHSVLRDESAGAHAGELVVDDEVVVFLLLGLAEESREVGDAVFTGGDFAATEVRQSGHEIIVRGEEAGFGLWCDLSGPASDEGALHSSLIAAALEAGASAGTIEDVTAFGSTPFAVGEVGFLAIG